MYIQLIKERKYWRVFFANNHDKRSSSYAGGGFSFVAELAIFKLRFLINLIGIKNIIRMVFVKFVQLVYGIINLNNVWNIKLFISQTLFIYQDT